MLFARKSRNWTKEVHTMKMTHRRKPRFLSQTLSDYLQQITDVAADEQFTIQQREKALNRIWRAGRQQFGFFSEEFQIIAKCIAEARILLERSGEEVNGIGDE